MAIAAPKPPVKSRREIGKLAQRRRALKSQVVEPEPVLDVDNPELVWKAIEAMDGFTYPIMGAQLQLAGGKFTMAREFRVGSKQFVTQVEMILHKKGGG